MQTCTPLAVLPEVAGHSFGNKNMPRVAAIHHALRNVNPGAGDVVAASHITDLTHWAAVNAHSYLNFRMFLERPCYLERTLRRLLRAISKNQRHPITRWQGHELFVLRLDHLR